MKEGALHELPGGWVWTRLEGLIEPSNEKADPLQIEKMPYYLDCPQFCQKYGGELLRKGQNDPINDTINDTIKNKFIQSYRIPSAFICVHLRLIFVSLSDRTRKIQFKLFTQSSNIPVTKYEKAAVSLFRTRMTRIARISTDQRTSASSAQSVFYCRPPAFYCLHPRLISSRKTQEALAR